MVVTSPLFQTSANQRLIISSFLSMIIVSNKRPRVSTRTARSLQVRSYTEDREGISLSAASSCKRTREYNRPGQQPALRNIGDRNVVVDQGRACWLHLPLERRYKRLVPPFPNPQRSPRGLHRDLVRLPVTKRTGGHSLQNL